MILRKAGLAAIQQLMSGQSSKKLKVAALVLSINFIYFVVGPHTDEKQDTEFWQSSTVANASNGKLGTCVIPFSN